MVMVSEISRDAAIAPVETLIASKTPTMGNPVLSSIAGAAMVVGAARGDGASDGCVHSGSRCARTAQTWVCRLKMERNGFAIAANGHWQTLTPASHSTA